MSDAPGYDTPRPDAGSSNPADEPEGPRRMPSSQPILLKALRWGGLASALLVVLCGVVGWFVSGSSGAIGGVLGAVFAGVFLALTAGSIAFANRFIGSDLFVGIFFGVVMGTWLVKFVAFIVAALLLRDQPWLNPTMFFLSLIAGVITSLVIDVLIVAKSRLGYVSDLK